MKKTILYILGIMALLLLGLFVYILVASLSLKGILRDLEHRKEAELKSKIDQERELIRRDIDEKYRADLVSFEVLAKRLEIEKERMKELEQRLEKKEKKGIVSPLRGPQ